jgi:hypothetical protein
VSEVGSTSACVEALLFILVSAETDLTLIGLPSFLMIGVIDFWLSELEG